VTAVAVKAAEAEAVRRRSVLQTPTILEEDEEGFDEKWFISVGEKGASKEYHRYLMCKGVEWGFQYHNFYGDWEISASQPVCNSRPHYVHNTMYGGHAHLFHTLDPHYHVPRWVIGPAPGNENGWAFAESDAATPDKVTATWISWDGFEWHSCKSFRFICKEHELDGLSEDEDVEQDQETFEETFAKDAHHAADQAADEAKRGKIHKMTNAEYEAMQTNRQKAVDIQIAAKQKETNDESGPHLSSPGVSASPDPNSSPYRKGQESTKGLESTRSAAGGKDKKGKKKKGGLFKKKK